jgi:hypothetical protein
VRSALTLVVLVSLAFAPGGAAPRQQDGIARLVVALEDALRSGSLEKLAPLAADGAVSGKLAALMRGERSNAVVRERDRNLGTGGEVDLLLDTFVERGSSGQIATWRATVRPGTGDAWQFIAFEELSAVDGLYRLALGTQAFDARGLTITSADYSLQMRSGLAFVAEAQGGVTAIVLRGRGEMVFTPQDPAEQRQVEILSKSTALRVPFEEAFVRVNPGEIDRRLGGQTLTPRASGPRDYARAVETFEQFASKTYALDLQDLSRDRWSLVPAYGDIVAEVRTKKFGVVTYAQSAGEAEDISVFQRDQRRNISVYPSAQQLATRGRFYSEDALADYDIEHHDVDVRITPAREWIDGTARLRARVRRQLSTLTLRLAESLVVRSVVAKDHVHLRVIGQNNLIVTLPAPAARGDVLELEVRYAGRLPAQALDREAMTVSPAQEMDPLVIPPEPRWIYSNRSYWYPQAPVTDFATARVRIAVPQPFDVVATGVQTGAAEPADDATPGTPLRAFTFESAQPARYLSCVISKFVPVLSRTMQGGGTLNVIASPRQTGRARNLADQAEQIFGFYRKLAGDAPYPQLTVAVSESDLPGGHSPAYFVLLNQTLPSANVTWRADPVNFENFPAFFIAHEIAHQWWGQSVGWKNYHEQWISEGFAQYFAALYAGEQRGSDTFANLMRQMRRWAIEESGEGPIYLGYRLGHIQGDSRVFRALVYNKAAVVLHMLRRLVGDERFFAGMRRFYEQSKFGKAGTDDFRRVMEAETGRNLERFFERWIYGFGVPVVKVTHHLDTKPGGESELVLQASQSELVYDLPVTIAIEHENGARREVLLLLTDRSAELRVPLDPAAGKVRRVDVDSDASALARFVR